MVINAGCSCCFGLVYVRVLLTLWKMFRISRWLLAPSIPSWYCAAADRHVTDRDAWGCVELSGLALNGVVVVVGLLVVTAHLLPDCTFVSWSCHARSVPVPARPRPCINPHPQWLMTDKWNLDQTKSDLRRHYDWAIESIFRSYIFISQHASLSVSVHYIHVSYLHRCWLEFIGSVYHYDTLLSDVSVNTVSVHHQKGNHIILFDVLYLFVAAYQLIQLIRFLSLSIALCYKFRLLTFPWEYV